jgi:hypothetical protein
VEEELASSSGSTGRGRVSESGSRSAVPLARGVFQIQQIQYI